MSAGVIGTAGHIDHGKTALVRALTGADTDRLPEEKRRGISIDLGFTHLALGDAAFGVVDVPGHEDFIRNMLAGTTGVDLLLLVVAADEGVMPQTREHLAIADLLEVPAAVVALTKADLVEPDWLELAREDVRETLAGTRFSDAAIVATSAVSGEGLDSLRAAILRHAQTGRGDPDDLFRLPVDRAFSVHGTGTVVTGTVWSGTLESDGAVRLLPGEATARVRGLQVHGEDVRRVAPGQRAAVALGGVDLDEVHRGMTLVTDDGWGASDRLAVRLRVLAGAGWAIEDRQRVRVHLGTGETMARVLLDKARQVEPGDTAFAQLRLESPIVARTRDRLVIRSYSPVTTVAGATVVDPEAPRRRPREADLALYEVLLRREPEPVVRALLRRGGTSGVALAALPLATGLAPSAVRAGLDAANAVVVRDRCFDPAAVEEVHASALQALERYHREHPLRPGMDPAELRREAVADTGGSVAPALLERVLDSLTADGEAVSRAGRIARAGHEPVLNGKQRAVRDRIANAVRAAGVALAPLEEVRAAVGDASELDDLLALLCAEGTLVKVDHERFADAGALQALTRELREALGGRDGLSPADFRDVARVSRKSLIPLLEYLDRVGVTVRTASGRRIAES